MGRHRALLVANAKYREDTSLPDLMAPIYDMSRLRDALINPTSGLFGRDDIRQLADARAADIVASMEDFFVSADRDDTLLLYYSGHGKTDINNNFFLCAADTKVDRLLSTAVRDETVNQMMRGSPATTFVVILDCCSSGSWKGGPEMPAALKGEGRFVLSSSRPGQNSSDATVLTESSPFTSLLVEALESADLDADLDGYVQIDDVYRHVEGRLKGQQAQRDYGKSTATVALARRPTAKSTDRGTPSSTADRREADSAGIDAGPDSSVGASEPPALTVSPEEIQIRDIAPSELPAIERLYVFNRGGGELSWMAESDNDWMTMEVHSEFVRVTLAPIRSGVHRGTIYVRPATHGHVTRVPVLISVSDAIKADEPPLTATVEVDESPKAGQASTTGIHRTSGARSEKRKKKTDRERLEFELKRLGYELDPWSPNLWYSDSYLRGHAKPRVAIRPPRVRLEVPDGAGTWRLKQSFSIDNELDAAVEEIAELVRPKPGSRRKPAWRQKMERELKARGFSEAPDIENIFYSPTSRPGPQVRVVLLDPTIRIEEVRAEGFELVDWSMDIELDESIAALDEHLAGQRK